MTNKMTHEKASEAEKAANKSTKYYHDKDIAGVGQVEFMKGVRWTIEQAEKMVMIPFPDNPEFELIEFFRLKKLLGDAE